MLLAKITQLPTLRSNLQDFGIEIWQIVCLVHEMAVGLWEQQWTEAGDESQNNVENFVTSFKVNLFYQTYEQKNYMIKTDNR